MVFWHVMVGFGFKKKTHIREGIDRKKTRRKHFYACECIRSISFINLQSNSSHLFFYLQSPEYLYYTYTSFTSRHRCQIDTVVLKYVSVN